VQKFDMGAAWQHSMELLRLYGWKVAAITALTYVAAIAVSVVVLLGLVGTAALGTVLDGFDQIAAEGFLMGFAVIVLFGIFVFASYYASWRLTLAREHESFAGSLVYGILASFPAMLVTMLVFAAFVLVAFLFSLFFGFSAAGLQGGGSFVLFLFVILILYCALAVFLVARLGLCGPVMAVNKSYNPFLGFAESWKMTRGSTGMLMLYVFVTNLVLGIAYVMVNGAAEAFASLTPVAAVITIPVHIAFAVLYTLVPAGMYNSMTGDADWSQQTVESIFD